MSSTGIANMTKPADVVTDYQDDDLTFFALVYKDYPALAQCLRDLRRHYTATRVILRSDGDPDPRFPVLAQRYSVDFRDERFRHLPSRSGSGLFGTRQDVKAMPSIQDGCMGFTRGAAEQILQSGMLRDRRLCEPAKFVDDSPYFVMMASRAARYGLASFDWGLTWIAGELGIPMFAFDEVKSGWRKAPTNPNMRYAVTHPRAYFQSK